MLQTGICAHASAGNGPGWTDARIERLKEFWADGLSASQIADRLGEVTRNAVIGKVHRLGLAGRKSGPRRTSPRRNRAGRVDLRPKVKPLRSYPLPPASPALMLSVAELGEDTCHWPVGDPRLPGFGFCGLRTAPGYQPYCAAHQHRGHDRRAR